MRETVTKKHPQDADKMLQDAKDDDALTAANGVDMNACSLRPMSFHAAPKQCKKPDTLTDEDRQHNAEVEKKKAAKRARKEARKQ